MLNCNKFDTTCLNMSLNITQFNVSAKYDLVIPQFNVSIGSSVIVHPDRTQHVTLFTRMCVVNHFLLWPWTERFWRLEPVVSPSFHHHGAEDVPSACSGPRMERPCEPGVADALARWNHCQRIKGRSVKIQANMFSSIDRLAAFLLRNPPDSDDESEDLQPPLKRTRRWFKDYNS